MRRGVFSIRIQRKEEKEFYYSFVIIVDRSTSTSCILLITIFSLSVGIYMRICIEREREGGEILLLIGPEGKKSNWLALCSMVCLWRLQRHDIRLTSSNEKNLP